MVNGLKKRFGLFNFKLKDGYITAEYKRDSKHLEKLIKKGVSKEFARELIGQNNYAIIGKEGTFKLNEYSLDSDPGILYPKITVKALDHKQLQRLLRYMNRVIGYYAFQEKRFLDDPRNILKGTDKYIPQS